MEYVGEAEGKPSTSRIMGRAPGRPRHPAGSPEGGEGPTGGSEGPASPPKLMWRRQLARGSEGPAASGSPAASGWNRDAEAAAACTGWGCGREGSWGCLR